MENTIQLHRILKAPVSRVFRAFSNGTAKMSWLPPFGFFGEVHNFDFKVGGRYQLSFTRFAQQEKQSWSGVFIEIKDNEKIVYKDKFDDPNMPGEMTVTITFKEVSCGTELCIQHEGIPEVIPTELCYLGWQDSLVKLAHLVEPDFK